jgi:hypothetical protein
MPTVPLYGEQKEALAPIPGVRKTAAPTAASFGAPLIEAQGQQGQVLEGIGAKAAKIGTDIVAEEQNRADQIAILNASTQASQGEHTLLYDPETGALTKHGPNSFGLPESVGADFNTLADKIAAGLSTPRQRLAFQKIRAEHADNIDLTLRRHVYGEMQRYEGQELEASLENSRNLAIANAMDPRRVGLELQHQVDAISTHAPRLGLGPEQVKEQIDATRSKTHIGVIEQMLATDQPRAARVYFEETREQINGDQQARIQKALNEGATRAESQKQADAIIGAGGTLQEQLEKVKAITDPEVRDATQTRVEHNDGLVKQRERDQEESALRDAFNVLDKDPAHSVSNIPPTAWVSFSGASKSALMSYSDRLNRGESIETDWRTFYKLIDQAGTSPDDFAKQNLLGYRAKLSDTEFKQIAEIQLAIRKKDGREGPGLAQFGTEEQIVNDSLAQFHFPTDPSKQSEDQKAAVAELRRRVREQVGLLSKKDITHADVQSIVDNILSQKTTTPGSWWGLIPFNGISLRDTTKPNFQMTITDVPQDYKDAITAALKSQHKPITDATILNTYIGMKGAGR